MKERAANILLVEDNEGDIELTQTAFEASMLASNLSVVHDGMEALDYLNGRGAYDKPSTPDLILLDLNMPRMGGREFLSIIKKDDRLKTIPVIMLTSSDASRDIIESYQHHANCYIIKPFGTKEYIELTRQVENFWTRLPQLPTEVSL